MQQHQQDRVAEDLEVPLPPVEVTVRVPWHTGPDGLRCLNGRGSPTAVRRVRCSLCHTVVITRDPQGVIPKA